MGPQISKSRLENHELGFPRNWVHFVRKSEVDKLTSQKGYLRRTVLWVQVTGLFVSSKGKDVPVCSSYSNTLILFISSYF